MIHKQEQFSTDRHGTTHFIAGVVDQLVELATEAPGDDVLEDLLIAHGLRTLGMTEDLNHSMLPLAGPVALQVGPVDLLPHTFGRRARVEAGSVVLARQVRARAVGLIAKAEEGGH